MTERTTERAAIARLAMSYVNDRLRQQRTARAYGCIELDIALARHRADLDAALGLADVRERLDTIEIDHVIRQHESHVEHRHERLSASEQPCIFTAAEQIDRFWKSLGVVIAERRRLHALRVSAGKGTLRFCNINEN